MSEQNANKSGAMKSMARGGAVFSAGSIAGMLLKFVMGVVVIRAIAKADYGLVSLGYVIANILVLLSSLGLANGVPRFIARLREHRAGHAAVGNVAGTSLVAAVATGLVFSVLLYTSADLIAASMAKPELAIVLRAFAFMVLPLALIQGLVAVFQGIQMVKPRAVYQDIAVNGLRLFLVLILLFLGFRMQGVLVAYVASVWGALLLFIIYARRTLPSRMTTGVNRQVFGELLLFSLPLLGVGVINRMTTWAGTMILGAASTAENVALYNAASRLIVFLMVPMTAMGFVFSPVASRYAARGDIAGIKDLYTSASKWITLLTFPVAMYFIIEAHFIVTLLFGDVYADAAPVLMVLSVAYLLHVAVGPNGATLIALGYPKRLLGSAAIAAVVAVTACALLIPKYGSVGAAIGTMLALMASNLYLSVLLYRQAGVHPLAKEYVRPVAFVLFISVLFATVAKLTPHGGIASALIFPVLVIAAIVAPLITRSLTEVDLDMLESLERRLVGRTVVNGRLRHWHRGDR